MLISPTERGLLLKGIGTASWVPEDYGCDVLWTAKGKMWGVQRKTPKDFVASVQDGRLNKEIQQMKHLSGQACIVIDGGWEWTSDGRWTGGFMTFTREQMIALLASIQKEGVWVFQAKNLDEVIATIVGLHNWSGKDKHVSLKGRREQMQYWGNATTRDFQIHMLTSLPGVGVELAERILDTLGMILICNVSLKELQSVSGIGKKKAEKILRILNSTSPPTTSALSAVPSTGN